LEAEVRRAKQRIRVLEEHRDILVAAIQQRESISGHNACSAMRNVASRIRLIEYHRRQNPDALKQCLDVLSYFEGTLNRIAGIQENSLRIVLRDLEDEKRGTK
jgi:hypothetical protein